MKAASVVPANHAADAVEASEAGGAAEAMIAAAKTGTACPRAVVRPAGRCVVTAGADARAGAVAPPPPLARLETGWADTGRLM